MANEDRLRLPDLNDAVEALTPRYLKEASYLRLYFSEGEVDFIAAGSVTDEPGTTETVLDRRVQVDTSIEVLGKKIKYRGAEFTARDVFDFSLIAEKEPKALPLLRPLLREQRDAILERLVSADKILRTTFAALEVLEYRRTYNECLETVKKALASA